MLASTFPAQLASTVHFRPLRTAFFVSHESEEGFVRAATVATSQWGGLHALMVPVGGPVHRYDGYFRRLLALFEPDVFVDFTGEAGTSAQALQAELARQFPSRRIALQSGAGFEINDHSLHALNAVPEEQVSARTLWAPSVSHWSASANAAVFGRVDDKQMAGYSAAFSTIRHHKLDLASSDFWGRQFEINWPLSPINLTSYMLQPLVVTNDLEGPHFDVVFGDSVRGLCLYWAIRAVREITQAMPLGRRTILCPISDIEKPDAAANLVAFLRRRLAVPDLTSSVDVIGHAWSDHERERAVAVLQQTAGLIKAPQPGLTVNHRFGRESQVEDVSTRQLRYAFYDPDLPGSFRAGVVAPASHPTVWQVGATTALQHEPVSGLARKWGNVAVDVESDLWRRYPRSPSVAKLIRAESWLSKWGLTRIGSLPGSVGYEAYSVPTEWAALSAWFKDRGFTVRMGAAGRYGEAALELLGGAVALERLATRQAYRLLDKLALKSSKKVAQYLKKYVQTASSTDDDLLRAFGDLELGPELKGIPRSLAQLASDSSLGPKSSLAATVATLSNLGAVVRGMFVSCQTCGSSEWYPLRALDERLICPGCRSEFSLPLIDGNGNELAWQFRLNSLVNRAVDQDLLPNLFALHRLTAGRDSTCRAIGLELLRDANAGDVAFEFDVVGVVDQRVIAAECKAGAMLAPKDIETARVAADCGCAEFWFTTAADQWSADSIAMIEAFKAEIAAGSSMAVETMVGDQLFGNAIIQFPPRS